MSDLLGGAEGNIGEADAPQREREKRNNPPPWTGKEERVPIGDTGDADCPFVIRDAGGKVVLTLWEQYGPEMEELHVELGNRLIAAVNALEK